MASEYRPVSKAASPCWYRDAAAASEFVFPSRLTEHDRSSGVRKRMGEERPRTFQSYRPAAGNGLQSIVGLIERPPLSAGSRVVG